MPKVTEINFVVGQLPEWYNEAEHDFALEQWLNEVAREQFEDVVTVKVEYVYNGGHFLKAFDEDGNEVSEIPFDMNGAFLAAKSA